MNVNFPDAATIRAALMLANRAPSVHNTQPWRWRVGEHSLHLYANRDLKLAHTDPDERDLILSCGAALHHCVVAFAALGWQSKIRRFPNPADPDHLASIQLHRHPASEADVSLAAAIPRRRTDRRTYRSWPVPQRDIGVMGARTARAGVMLRRVEELDKLKSVVTEAAWQHRTDAEYLTELTTWSGRYASTAGVPARNTPTPDSKATIPARTFAGPVLAQPDDVDPTDDNAVVIALGTAEDDEVSRLRAGEATSLVLLTATALGLASCPITEPLEIPETREEIRADVFGGDAYPQMLMRIGWASINAEPLPSTPRRDFSETVAGLDESFQ